MSRRRPPSGEAPHAAARRSVSGLPRQLAEHVRTSNRVIRTLQAELAECRRRYRDLSGEHGEMQRVVERLEWMRRQAAAPPERPSPAPPQVADPQLVELLEQENLELRNHCSKLENALADATEEARIQRELAQELQAIVELLGHQLQMAEGDE